MNITRQINGQTIEIELTKEEIAAAHKAHVISFMKNELINEFDYDNDVAEEIAECAYDKYCDGDGLTEYECIEYAVNEYKEEFEE